METICKKKSNLFSEKNEKTIFNVLSVAFAHGVVNVNLGDI